jgi:hypothetical protein
MGADAKTAVRISRAAPALAASSSCDAHGPEADAEEGDVDGDRLTGALAMEQRPPMMPPAIVMPPMESPYPGPG